MATRHATVIGVFQDREQARTALDELRRAGFGDDRIGMVSRDRTDLPTASGEKPGLLENASQTRWGEGSGLGAAAGAVTGTGLGLAVAAGLMTGVGPVIAGGTLMALLASAGAGATTGAILGALVGLGVPEQEAKYYEQEFTSGRTIVTVRADDRSTEAWDILTRHGAYGHQSRSATATP
jgi:hypothetical protein